MSCEQGAMSLEQGALSGEQGAMSLEQGALSGEQGAVNFERGMKILNTNPNQNALDASLEGGVFEGSLRSKS